ncbi:MAG: hypothetical protein KatS3mg114_1239 [Planctomycetaceae bacterium]|nr:MAG: hypothetical protein KatS3mg114_1239 [Planctomycetaceae bacterium]
MVSSVSKTPPTYRDRPWPVLGWFLLGSVLLSNSLRLWLSESSLAMVCLSPASWRALVGWMGGHPHGETSVELPWWPLFLGLLVLLAGKTVFLGLTLARWQQISAGESLLRVAKIMGRGCTCLGLWEPIWVALNLLGWTAAASCFSAGLAHWIALGGAGTLTACLATGQPKNLCSSRNTSAVSSCTSLGLTGLVSLYWLVFFTMNARLWCNLYIPHGDSAMYEEHLWNLLHGKGFRSYLDPGLFLGEHLQVVHLLLLPVYVLCPHHLTLEACESLALGLGVFPVARMIRRATQSERLAFFGAVAYLLYFPLQFLDIEIDLKTFRPEAFGIPLLLWTLDEIDQRRGWGTFVGCLLCLTVKEDYTLILGPLGLWLVGRWLRERWQPQPTGAQVAYDRRWLYGGVILAAFSVLYLWWATRVVMPWFRGGEEIHYSRYFQQLGQSPEEIVRTVLFRPGELLPLWLHPVTLSYGCALLLPVGGVACVGWERLLVGVPWFLILNLSEITRDPRHHFHAPLVAIVFWATASGLGRLQQWLKQRTTWHIESILGWWLSSSSLYHAVFFSLSPVGLAFWDPGSHWNGWRLYGPTLRGRLFQPVWEQIPRTARVASTDYVHPRFTHHERSYDYSDYVRKVSGYERKVPDDTEYIVIDTTHWYSRYHRPEDVPEYHEQERWELLPDRSQGYYVVLRRRSSPAQFRASSPQEEPR